MHVVGPLADWRVRSALMEAIDYKGIISAVTFGLDTVDNSEFLQGMQGWTNATATYWENHENITDAKLLLAQAGYPNGFSITLYTRPGSRYGVEFDTLSQILQSDWAQIGVSATIEVYEVG
jgi:dipeptide transport system substrate-binding protein